MFENYPTYIKQIFEASKRMPASKKTRLGKQVAASMTSAVLTGIILATGNTNAVSAQADLALNALKTEAKSGNIVVNVETETENETLFAEDINPLTVAEETTLIKQVKDSIASGQLTRNDVTNVDDNTIEINVTTPDNIPIKIVMKTDEKTGEYVVESTKVTLSKKDIKDKKEASANTKSTDEQKTTYASPLNDFTQEAFNELTGINNDSDSEEEYNNHLSVIAPNIVLTVPQNFESREVEQPEEETQKTNETNTDTTSTNNTSPTTQPEKSHMKQYARSWKDNDGSIISVRAENLGPAFSNMNGLEATTKMKGYWEETSSAIASQANQELRNADDGYHTEIFYDEKSECWGYWGHVEYTDKTRNITYNRLTLIDEISNQMFTISYRNDSRADNEEPNAYSLDDFKKIVTNAPAESNANENQNHQQYTISLEQNVDNAEAQNADTNTKNSDADPLISAYRKGLSNIEILPGHTKTVDAERVEAEKLVTENTAQQD